MVAFLNFLHKNGIRKLQLPLLQLGYLLKGKGFVKANYFPDMRAYAYKVKGVTYLSRGPGWAYSFEFLKATLADQFCFYYFPKAGDCVIDVGAGLGEESVIFAQQVGHSGKVYAIEANPVTYTALSYLFETNGFDWVQHSNLAIYNQEGVVSIEDDEDNYLTNTVGTLTPQKKTFQVQAKTFDQFVKENNIGTINFLKVNIEGAEQFLIQGMEQSIGRIENICISCHDFRHVHGRDGEFYLTKEKVASFLSSHGFEINFRKTGMPHIDDYIYARKKLDNATKHG